jgi:hypothetical protein
LTSQDLPLDCHGVVILVFVGGLTDQLFVPGCQGEETKLVTVEFDLLVLACNLKAAIPLLEVMPLLLLSFLFTLSPCKFSSTGH